MSKRNEPVKQITVSLETYKKFLSFKQYSERNEGTLIKIMDLADKAIANPRT
jgi:hypothetical protein